MTTNHLYAYLDAHADAGRIQLVGPLAQPDTELSEPVIFVDGGAALRQNNMGLAVGDGDSYPGALDYRLDPDKDFSDLAFALSLVESRFGEIELHGFLGGRRDHELLNLGEVFHFLNRLTEPARLRMDDAVDAFSTGSWQFHRHGLFSLVVFSPARVALSGDCRYPIATGTLIRPVSSLGLSNEGHGDIQLESDGPVFIFHDGDHGA
jgi:thiamine pyrophosphokinase